MSAPFRYQIGIKREGESAYNAEWLKAIKQYNGDVVEKH